MIRLDLALVEKKLVQSREQARRLIEAGAVRVNGAPGKKASQQVEEAAVLEVTEPERFASRGGLKLEAALEHFKIGVEGTSCLDIGISTGGFTDCLLQRGAARVTGVDVGHGQLAKKLQGDPRLELREGVNARDLPPGSFPARFDLVVIDVSFISLLKILPPAIEWVGDGGCLIALIKPQFEVGREHLPASGVVKDRAQQEEAIRRIEEWWATRPGWRIDPVIPSPILGGEGNREFLVCGRKSNT